MNSRSKLRSNGSLEPKDRELLRNLSGAGNFRKSCELAADDDLGMDQAEVEERLQSLVARGYVKAYFTATVEGSVALRGADS